MLLEPFENYGSWSGAEIEKFLVETRIPIRLSLEGRNGLLIVPVWFEYNAGRFVACSPNDSTLVQSLRARPAVAFDVSTNDMPYRGVRGRGIASCTTTQDGGNLTSLLRRYTGSTDNSLARWLLNRPGLEALIEIELTWVMSWDFSSRMRDIEKISQRAPSALI